MIKINVEQWLRRTFKFKEIGWYDIGEKFTCYQLAKTRWFNVYLHQLTAPNWHPKCHDHPWGFIAILLKKGYYEQVGTEMYRRRPGSILFRPATFKHNVITPYGESWSLILTTPKSRDWGFAPCDRMVPTLSYQDYVRQHDIEGKGSRQEAEGDLQIVA